MAVIDPIRIEVEREEDGRFLASIPDLPGVMAYGHLDTEAIQKAKTIALQVIADMIETGEGLSTPIIQLLAKSGTIDDPENENILT